MSLTAEYARGYTANPGEECPFIWSSDSWGAWHIGRTDRLNGMPSRGALLRKSRGNSYRFGKDPHRIGISAEGTVRGLTAERDLLDGETNAAATFANHRGSLL